ncbi:hypothetical protein IWX47DRAFT_610207 [Phyllosticta citricarpa]
MPTEHLVTMSAAASGFSGSIYTLSKEPHCWVQKRNQARISRPTSAAWQPQSRISPQRGPICATHPPTLSIIWCLVYRLTVAAPPPAEPQGRRGMGEVGSRGAVRRKQGFCAATSRSEKTRLGSVARAATTYRYHSALVPPACLALPAPARLSGSPRCSEGKPKRACLAPVSCSVYACMRGCGAAFSRDIKANNRKHRLIQSGYSPARSRLSRHLRRRSTAPPCRIRCVFARLRVLCWHFWVPLHSGSGTHVHNWLYALSMLIHKMRLCLNRGRGSGTARCLFLQANLAKQLIEKRLCLGTKAQRQ